MLTVTRRIRYDRTPGTPSRFVRGGVLFLVDRSLPPVPGYEWIDDHTVRIHPDAVEMMEARLSVGDDD